MTVNHAKYHIMDNNKGFEMEITALLLLYTNFEMIY